MNSAVKPTSGPAEFRKWAQNKTDILLMEKHGIKPIRVLMNDGSAPVMVGDKRVALVDCQTDFKRGKGHLTECAERDANAELITEAFNVHHESGLTPRGLHNYCAEADLLIANLQGRIAVLEEALRFYADIDNFLFIEDYGFLEYAERNRDLQSTKQLGTKAKAALRSPADTKHSDTVAKAGGGE